MPDDNTAKLIAEARAYMEAGQVDLASIIQGWPSLIGKLLDALEAAEARNAELEAKVSLAGRGLNDYAAARLAAEAERDEALAKLVAVAHEMAPERTIEALGVAPDSEDLVDSEFLGHFATYAVERTARIRAILAPLCNAPSMIPAHTCGLTRNHDGDTHTAYWKGQVFAVWGKREKEEATDGDQA